MNRKEILTVITRRGQTTIPVEIRRAFGLKKGDKIAFVLEGDQVRIKPTGSVVASTAGILKPDQPPLSAKELREVAEQAIAEETADRLGV